MNMVEFEPGVNPTAYIDLRMGLHFLLSPCFVKNSGVLFFLLSIEFESFSFNYGTTMNTIVIKHLP